jgi:hypothetical protein
MTGGKGFCDMPIVFREYPFAVVWGGAGSRTFGVYRGTDSNEIGVFAHAVDVPDADAAGEVAAAWWVEAGRAEFWGPEEWYVTRDRQRVSPPMPDENACFVWLLEHQGQSVFQAITHEGYSWDRAK